MLVIPISSHRLANASQHQQAAQIVVLDMTFTELAEKAEGGRHGKEFAFSDALPVSRRYGIYGSGFKDIHRNSL